MTEWRHGDQGWGQTDRTPSLPFPWMAPGACSRPSALQGPRWLAPRPRGREGRQDWRWPSLVLQAATELPPAPLPSPAACLETEGLQLVLKGLMVHGPVVLGLTEGLGQDGRVNQYREWLTLGGDLPSPWAEPIPYSPTLPHPWYRVLWEELLIAALEDIHLRIVEAGIVVGGSVTLPDETAPETSRGVGVRAGRAAGYTSGDLFFFAPTPLWAMGSHRRLE